MEKATNLNSLETYFFKAELVPMATKDKTFRVMLDGSVIATNSDDAYDMACKMINESFGDKRIIDSIIVSIK